MAGGHQSPVLLLCCIKGETVDREIGFLGELVGDIRGLVIVEPKDAFSGGASRHLAVSPRLCWPCKVQVLSIARSPPQPSLLMGEGSGGGEMAAHDTRIVSHSAAVPPTDVAMGALNIIYHFLWQERRFVGYTAVLCKVTSEL